MEEPQDGLGDLAPVVLEVRRLGRLVRVVHVLDRAGLHANLDLALDHELVKGEMGLGREQPVLDVQALDLGVRRGAPDKDVLVLGQEALGRVVVRGLDDVVLVHLVEVDGGVLGPEQALSGGGQVDLGVAELPVPGGSGSDFGAQQARKKLVSETDAGEVEFGTAGPQLWRCGQRSALATTKVGSSQPFLVGF